MQEKTIELELNGLKESYTFGKVAKQANGSVLYRQGKAVLLATVVMDDTPVNEPFLPLTVQYIEKAYAAAKIPGGFIKRESKPSDFETLTSRIIDRSLRPMFPSGFAYPVVIDILVLSSDSSVDLQIAALHAANAALVSSNLPVEKSISGVRIGRNENGIVINPTLEELDNGSLDLLLVGDENHLTMIEMAVKATEKIDKEILDELERDVELAPLPLVLPHQSINEVDEDSFIEYVDEGLNRIESASKAYKEAFLPLKKEILELEDGDSGVDEELKEFIAKELVDEIDHALYGLSKSERAGELQIVRKEAEILLKKYDREVDEVELLKALDSLVKDRVRRQILKDKKRADGRNLDEVRPISIETNLLPSVHGSCLFTRGETQALVTATLGDAKDAQMYELLSDKSPRNERFMVHYNFPAFSVGEAKPIGAPGRRELGHGNLAKRALEPVVDINLSQTIRIVSEILESNGSSSMATVCGGSLALYSAEVAVEKLVAGVAMGLVTDKDEYAVLTDIMGLEDRYGDMDFKVAGTKDGITAMQMDIKGGGLDLNLLKEALYQAKNARLHILSLMEEAKENIKPSGALPVTEHFTIDPSKIVHIIGKAGSTIREIIQKFEVAIDLDRDKGGVKVTGQDKEKVLAAKAHIENIADSNATQEIPKYEIGKHYIGKVKRVVDFGLFVELPGDYDALLHISKISKGRIDNLEEKFHPGDTIEVVVLDQKGKKVELATPDYLGE